MLLRTFAASLVILASLNVLAQDPATGFPPYGSFNVGQFDGVNQQNLNANFAIPIVSSPARGMDFNFAIVHDSLIWKRWFNAWVRIADESGSFTYGWKKDFPVGQIASDFANLECEDFKQISIERMNYRYTDARGTVHPFDAWYYRTCWGEESGGVATRWTTAATTST